MFSTSRVRSFSTGSPYWRMVRLGIPPFYRGGSARPAAATQKVAGSTSTRRPRPGGRGTAARRSQRVSWSGARTKKRSSASADTETDGSPPPDPGTGVGRGQRAREEGQGDERRQGRHPAHRPPPRPARAPVRRGRRLRAPGGRAPGSGPARGPRARRWRDRRRAGRPARRGPRCPRWPRGAVPAGAGRCRGRRRPRPGAPGAARPRCRPAPAPVALGLGSLLRTGHLAHLDPEQRRQLLAQAAHPGSQRLHAQAAAVRRTPPAASRHSGGRPGARLAVLGGGGTTAGAAGQLATVGAGQQASPARPVVDADERARARGRARRRRRAPVGQPDQLLGEQPVRGSARGGRPVERRPAGALRITAGRPSVNAAVAVRVTGGTGETTRQGAPSAPRPLEDHVHRAVGGAALLPVGRVVGIEHDGGGQPGHRGPGPRPGPDHDGPAGPGLGPVGGGRPTPADQAGGQPARPTRPRAPGRAHFPPPDAGGPGPAWRAPDRADRWPEGGGPPSPARTASASRHGRGRARLVRRAAPAGRAGAAPAASARSSPATAVPRKEDGGAGPAPGRPVRQLDHRGRRSPAQPRLEGQHLASARLGHVHRRPPSPARCARAAAPAPGCRPPRVGPTLLGDGVVEHLGAPPPPRCARARAPEAPSSWVRRRGGTATARLLPRGAARGSEPEGGPQVVDPGRGLPGELLLGCDRSGRRRRSAGRWAGAGRGRG